MYLGVYSVFQVCAVVLVALLVWYDRLPGLFRLTNTEPFRHCFTTMTIQSGIKLHWITLTTVTSSVSQGIRILKHRANSIRAPMTLFSTVDTGVLVNRRVL